MQGGRKLKQEKKEEQEERSAVDEFLDFGPAIEKDWRELSDDDIAGLLGSWRVRNNADPK